MINQKTAESHLSNIKKQKLERGKSLTIKTKTTLIAIAIGVFPVSIIGFFGHNILVRSITQEIEIEQVEKTEIAANNLTIFLEDRIREIDVIAKEAAFTNAKLSKAMTLKEKTAILDIFKDRLKYYNSIVFFDVKGNPIFQAKSDAPNTKNYADHEYFQEAVKTQKMTINGPGISSSSGQLRVEFAAPVKDSATGELLGILRFKIPGDYINIIFDIYQKQKQHWNLVNSEGIIFAGDRVELLNQPISEHMPDIQSLHQAKKNGVVKFKINKGNEGKGANHQSDEELNKSNNHEKILSDGHSAIIAYVTAKAPEQFPDVQIGTLLTVDEDVAFASVRELDRVLLLGTIVAAILVSAIATQIVHRATIPLIEAVTAVKKIGNGELDTRLAIAGKDELGELNANINLMAEQIQSSLEEQQNFAEQQRQEKEQLENAIYTLIEEISEATEGDLTVRANLDSMELSTVADLFNAIINNLQEIAIEARESTSQVGDSLKQNEDAIRLLAEQAIAEAQETRNTLLSVREMSQSIQIVAQNADRAEQIFDDTYNEVLTSTKNMDLTVDSILNLRTTVGETAKKMQRLGESSQKISQAVSLIEEIALKTNVLAINAGAEADRAGKYGQGFAVVAEQVGALAKQCTAATKEIASIIAAIQAETKEVNQAMESGTNQVLETTGLVESTKESLSLVLEKSREINLLMESISQSTVSQANTSQNVTELMQKIARLSENTSQSSQEVAQSIMETAQVAAKLQSTVAQFKVENRD